MPKHCFLAMDYHLDWIELAIHLVKKQKIQPGCRFLNPSPKDINKSQEDIDLLIAFEESCANKARTHLVLIEAKAYLAWSNDQLESKVSRLRRFLGEEIQATDELQPHFVLMTGRTSSRVEFRSWPTWMKSEDGEPFRLAYELPMRRKVTRCDEKGKDSAGGCHLRLDCDFPE